MLFVTMVNKNVINPTKASFMKIFPNLNDRLVLSSALLSIFLARAYVAAMQNEAVTLTIMNARMLVLTNPDRRGLISVAPK